MTPPTTEIPPPPPEAVLIRVAREARGLSAETASERALIRLGPARWRQIEAGYERREPFKATHAPPRTLAHMARVVGVSPEQLDDTGRPDAGDVLREIIRQEGDHRSGSAVMSASSAQGSAGAGEPEDATAATPPVIPDEPPPDLPRDLAARYRNLTTTERAILWLPDTTPAEREQLVSIWQAIHKLTTDTQAAAREEARPGTVSEMRRRG